MINTQLLHELEALTIEEQEQVLNYVKSLKQPQGIPGEILWQRAQEVNFDADALEEIEAAIREGDKIDWDSWK